MPMGRGRFLVDVNSRPLERPWVYSESEVVHRPTESHSFLVDEAYARSERAKHVRLFGEGEGAIGRWGRNAAVKC